MWMLGYFLLSLLLSIAYIIIIIVYRKGWDDLSESPNPPLNYKPQTSLSVLIAARNEEDSIGKCLDSIIAQHYPADLLEVIVINDFSTDNTAKVAQAKGVKVITLSDFSAQGSKKKAIEVGVAQANGQLIVATDADCVAGKKWLQNIAYFYETTHAKFIAAPVNFHQEKNLFERAQSLDFLGLMLITGAGIHKGFMHMCNGANLAYERSVFYEVDGFKGIDQLASGDDMLLMQKVALKHPNSLGFIKNREATVFTHAKPTLKSFVAQRVRWASKTNSYKEVLVTTILAFVFFLCSNIVLSLLLIPFLGMAVAKIFLFQMITKAIMDYYLLSPTAHFFRKENLMKDFFPSFIGHTIYIVAVGFLANMVYNYEWKGRRVR